MYFSWSRTLFRHAIDLVCDLIAQILTERNGVPQKRIAEEFATSWRIRLAKGIGQRITMGGRVMNHLEKAAIARFNS